jgi:membrane-associated phospholipid phosphatase
VRKILARLETFELLVFGYSAVVAALILASLPRVPHAGAILAAHAGLTASVAALAWASLRFPGRFWRVARDCFPALLVPIAFRELHYVIPAVHPGDMDATLMAWDRAIFGEAPTILFERLLHPLAVEVLQLCYASYYFLPMILGVALYRQGRLAAYREGMALIVLAFLTSFLGYFLLPAQSPYVNELVLGHARRWGEDPASQGYGLAPLIRDTLLGLEWEMRDAFPSGHAEVTIVTLACAWRLHRPVFWALVGPGTGLVLATVYLRLHFAVDVLAGAALAVAIIWAGPSLHRRWERRREAWNVERGADGPAA